LQTFNSLPVDQEITAPVDLASGLFSYSATPGGFYSTDQPINWLRITPGSGAYATVNNLYVGGTATPEPGTVACVFGGLLALTVLRRRLRRS
jgi:hypothetical protein